MSSTGSNGDNTFSLYGVNVSESGKAVNFSLPFVLLNMIGGGLSWFIAMAWSNVFQSALDEYKKKKEAEGVITNPVWLNLVLALTATVFTVSIVYLMIQIYQQTLHSTSKWM